MSVLAPLPRRQIVTFGGKDHATDGHGHLLCSPVTIRGAQLSLVGEPTCGWCKLILDGRR